ncbi:hypothetical protein P4H21_08580 [Bacillus cereus]|nr:hypothetical protein [Bacillus cereus]
MHNNYFPFSNHPLYWNQSVYNPFNYHQNAIFYAQPYFNNNFNPYFYNYSRDMIPENRAFDIGGIEKVATDSLQKVVSTVDAVVQNTVDDISLILNETANCAASMGRISMRVAQRAIEYNDVWIKQLIDAQILPIDLIEKVWEQIGWKLEKYPNPRIFLLENPRDAVWGGAPANFKEVDVNKALPMDRVPFLFVHGAEYNAFASEAFKFYRQFELAAGMFNNNITDYSKADIYIVSYDSKLTDEEGLIIRKGISTVLGGNITGDAPNIYASVLWKELERRAKITANEKIFPFLRQIALANNKGRAVTHSLGCLCLAHAANQYISGRASIRPAFSSWFCMAAAIPTSAFTRTGEYTSAPLIAGIPDGIAYGTSVWSSKLDSVLSTMYVLANNRFAMGQWGALQTKENYYYTNLDVTKCVRGIHEVKEGEFGKGYFEKISLRLKRVLKTGGLQHMHDCAYEFTYV